MSITRGLIISAAFCSVAGFAAASPTRLNDVQFVAASRCLGIISSKALGTGDAAALASYVDQQSRSRDVIAQDRADEAREDAMHEANRVAGERKDRLIAERDGACQAYIAPTSQAGGGAAHGGGAGPARTLP
jgi:hypothetical protein